MENVKKFSTTTFGGFNKEDVSNYIDSIIADHDEEVTGLRDELDDANDKINEFKKVVEQQYVKIVDATSQIERFVNENNELKARYTKITAQFSMISDAKLEAKRIVTTAHEEARLVSENAKTQLFELAKRAKSMSEHSANTSAEVDTNAKEMAKQTIDDARKKETEILAYAKKEADDTTVKAQEEAQTLIDEARTKAERTILRALEEAQSKDDEIVSVAQRKAMEAYSKAKDEADKIIYEAQGKANDILLIAAQQAEQVLSDARKQATEILANTQKQADENVALKEEEMLIHAREKARVIVDKAEDKLKNADLVILDAESKLEKVLTTESDILDSANKKAEEIINRAREEARQLAELRGLDDDIIQATNQAEEIIKKAKTLSQKALDDTKREIDMKLRALADQESKAEKTVVDAKREADKILRNAKREAIEIDANGIDQTAIDFEVYEDCLQQIAIQRARLLEILEEIKEVTRELPDYKRQDIQEEIYKTLDSNRVTEMPKVTSNDEVSRPAVAKKEPAYEIPLNLDIPEQKLKMDTEVYEPPYNRVTQPVEEPVVRAEEVYQPPYNRVTQPVEEPVVRAEEVYQPPYNRVAQPIEEPVVKAEEVYQPPYNNAVQPKEEPVAKVEPVEDVYEVPLNRIVIPKDEVEELKSHISVTSSSTKQDRPLPFRETTTNAKEPLKKPIPVRAKAKATIKKG